MLLLMQDRGFCRPLLGADPLVVVDWSCGKDACGLRSVEGCWDCLVMSAVSWDSERGGLCADGGIVDFMRL